MGLSAAVLDEPCRPDPSRLPIAQAQPDLCVGPGVGPVRSRIAFSVGLLLTPRVAQAHGLQAAIIFLVFPAFSVGVLLVLGLRDWNAPSSTKRRTALCVAVASASLLALNVAIEGLALVMAIGSGAYFLGIALQVAIPAMVWWFCRRHFDRAGHVAHSQSETGANSPSSPD